MFRIRFSNKEVHTPLTTEQMIAQMQAVKNEDDVETSQLKTFRKDSKGYYLAYPQAEMEPGMAPIIRKARNLSLVRMLVHLFGRRRMPRGQRLD